MQHTELAAYRKKIEHALAERFDGTAQALHAWGLHQTDAHMAQLLKEIMRLSGKRLRAFLVEQWYATSTAPNEHSLELATIVEAVHAATLVIDDVQDRSTLRRGEPCFHTKHGEPLAINTGILLLYAAANAAQTLPNGAAIARALNEQLTELVLGQGYDVLWEHEHALTTTLQDYRLMAGRKTGALFAFCAKAADHLANQPHDNRIDCLFEQLGVLFQLSDDVLNVLPEANLGKEFAEDIREKKITAVFITAWEHARAHDREILRLLYTKKELDTNDVQQVLTIFSNTQAREHIKTLCQTLVTETKEQINEIVTNARQREVLLAFLTLVDRV